MCTPTIVHQAIEAVSRRQMLGASVAAVAGALVVGGRLHGQPANRREISVANCVDLTHPLTAEFPLYPSAVYTPFKKTPIAQIPKDGYSANRWELVEHCGTHMDAPSHFAEGQADLAGVAPANLIAALAVIDIRERARRDADAAVSVDDLGAWEKRHGRLPDNAAVVLQSGWDAKAKDAKAFIGGERAGALHFPGFAGPAVDFLLKERKIVGIGVDTLSLDIGAATEFVVHKTWLQAGKWGLECVANLSNVPPAGATVIVAPPRVPGASGGPTRVLAVW